MKSNHLIPLLIAVFSVMSMHGQAQTTPTGVATPTNYPVGAIVTDSLPAPRPPRKNNRTRRGNRNASQNSHRNAGNAGADSQKGQYQQSSAANGTAINNSNATNYNSNNATNPATGVGSTPSSTNPATSDASAPSGSSGSNNASAAGGPTQTGTGAAVTGARTTTAPAVVAGSTERNTSIHDFIASSPNYTTLQNALQSVDLNELFEGSESYTLFAPSNAAFKKLPATVQAGLLEGRNRDALKQILSYHIVRGAVDAATLMQQIKSGNGKAQLQTLAGETLTAQSGSGETVTLTDEQGKTAIVDAPDKLQANGVVHGVDTVLLPKSGANAIR